MSDRRAHMARSSLIVIAAYSIAKLVGLLRERAIAHQFGATAEYDAYIAAFKIPDLLFTLIAGGALVSAFLPVFSEALTRGDRREAWTISSGVTNLIFGATVILAGLAALAAPWLMPNVIAPGFAPGQAALAASLMQIILLSTLVFALSGIQMGILNAFQHFLLPAIAPIAYNLGILFGAVFLAPQFGIYGLAYGVLLGAVLHLLVKVPGLIRYGFRWYPVLGLGHPGVREVLWLMWPRVLALGTVQVTFIVTTAIASTLTAGSLSALNYGWVIAQMPQTLIGTAIATVAFPTLAEFSARGQLDRLRDTGVGAIKVLIVLSVPAAVGLWILGGPVIDVLLRTGRFDAAAASATLLALRLFALGLVGHVTLEVVARMFYAQKDTLTPLLMAGMAMIVNIALAVILVEPLAHGGLALANSIAVSLEVVLGLRLLGHRLGGVHGRALAGTLARALLASLGMAAAIVGLMALLPAPPASGLLSSPFVSGLVLVTVGAAVGFAVYALLAAALGLEEVRAVHGLVRGALRRR